MWTTSKLRSCSIMCMHVWLASGALWEHHVHDWWEPCPFWRCLCSSTAQQFFRCHNVRVTNTTQLQCSLYMGCTYVTRGRQTPVDMTAICSTRLWERCRIYFIECSNHPRKKINDSHTGNSCRVLAVATYAYPWTEPLSAKRKLAMMMRPQLLGLQHAFC